MNNFLYHILGLCGEAHLNIFTLTISIFIINYIYKIYRYDEQNRT